MYKSKNYLRLDLLVPSKHREYFLGLLITDGAVEKKGKSCTLRFSSVDRDLTEAFVKSSETPVNINNHFSGNIKWNTRFRANIACSNKYAVLESFGIIPNKTFREKVPREIDSDCFWHFLRGVIDGDGCISNKIDRRDGKRYTSIQICSGSRQFLIDLVKLVKKRVDVKCSTPYKVRSIFGVYFGHRASRTLFPLIYNNSEGLRCERKYKKRGVL